MIRRIIFPTILAVFVWGALILLVYVGINQVRNRDEIEQVSVEKASPIMLAIGDYHVQGENWPKQTEMRLQNAKTEATLLQPITGENWSSEDALAAAKSQLADRKYAYIFVQVGVYDWINGVSPQAYAQQMTSLIDLLLGQVVEPNRVVLLSLPDLSAPVAGSKWGDKLTVLKGISNMNIELKQIAASRKITYVDIFPESQRMRNRADFVAQDGLRPSATMYSLWADMVFAEVAKSL